MQNLTDIRALKTRYIRDWHATRVGVEFKNFNNFYLTPLNGKIFGFLTADTFPDDLTLIYKYNFYVLR